MSEREDIVSAGTCMINHLKKHKMMTVAACLVIAASIVAALLPPQILRFIVDDILEGRQSKRLFSFAMLYTGAYLLTGCLGLLNEVFLICISQGISREIRISMLKHINRLTYTNFIQYDSASLEAYFNNDVQAIDRLITSGVISILMDAFKMAGILVSIFVFSWQFGIFVLLLLPFLVWFTLFVRKRMFRAQLKTRNLEGRVNHLVYENIENMQAIQLYDKGSSSQKYGKVLDEHFAASQVSVFYEATFPVVTEILKDTVIVLLILLSGFRGDVLGMSVGMVVSTISLLTDLFSPIENLGMELQTIQKSMAGLNRINQFFALEEEEEKLPFQELDKTHLQLRFEDVSFSYDGKEDVISHFNYCMEGLDKITLQGRSGAGKSTLMKLAYGLLKPTSGRVTINGLDTALLPDEMRQGLFGIVYQDPFFSGESIYEELTMHRDIPKERVWEALKLVGMERITNLEKKFSENDFSTGELSLLNIARVILTDCRILFLDEMNARIDPTSAKKIMEIMNRIAVDKMVLSINHYGDLLQDSKVLWLDAVS